MNLNPERDLWEENTLDVVVFWKVGSAAVAVQRVMDYLIEHPAIRLVCGDFGPLLGRFISELRKNNVAANVCGYSGHNVRIEETGLDPMTRVSNMAVVVLGAVKD